MKKLFKLHQQKTALKNDTQYFNGVPFFYTLLRA